MWHLLLAFAEDGGIQLGPGALVGGTGLGGALLYVGMMIGRVASKFDSLVAAEVARRKAEDEHRKAENDHREAERKHWEREEAMLRYLTAVPQRMDTGQHTPVHGLPIGE